MINDKSANCVLPENPIKSDYNRAKWFETFLIEGLAEVEVSQVCWKNAGEELGWNEFKVREAIRRNSSILMLSDHFWGVNSDFLCYFHHSK